MQKKGIIVSGMRPTGALHLGNYLGALENWIRLQDEYECYYFVADYHALTTGYDNTDDFKNNITNALIDWLAAGLDPEKCTIFIQSNVREHAELNLLFSMNLPLSWLYRCPTYKDQINQLKDKNISTYGFLGYPCLMSADILLYKAAYVPVGEDQLPHLELTREIARRFNFLYNCEVFPEPQPLLTKAKVLPGLDGRKMSKSYNNTIALSDSPDVVRKKVMSMVTDPQRIHKTDPGHPEVCSVFAYHKLFSPEEVDEIEHVCRNGEIGCVACKKKLAENIEKFMTPIYERRQDWLKRTGDIMDIIKKGNEKASSIASKTMAEVRKAMKIDWI
ncbi:MAG: tryptophan--tRNA ligase [Clostridiaceae bacterium]|nr:tryptophan--tRNA ligase [Clostridiaceae bacterium]